MRRSATSSPPRLPESASDADADADPADWPADAVEVGRILDAWGVKGWFKVQPHSADPQALYSSRRWWTRSDRGATRLLRITHAREHGDAVLAAAEDVADRDGAEALKGVAVFVSRASFPTPDTDEFYWLDLIGLAVVNRDGAALGTVSGLIDTGAHSVLRVVPDDGNEGERLIPFVAAYIDGVDLGARRIDVDWGLDY